MKLSTATLSILFTAFSLVGCGQQDFSGKALSSHLNPPGSSQCKPKQKNQSVELAKSEFELKGRKVLLEESTEVPVSGFAEAEKTVKKGQELVVVLDEQCVEEKREQNSFMSANGLTSEVEIGRFPASEKSHLVVAGDDMPLSDLEFLAENDPCVKGVGPNGVYYTTAAPNDPMFSQQEHHVNMKSAAGWDVFYNSTDGIKENIVIAVIDTGVEITHSDISANKWVNPGEVAGNGQDDDGNGYVDDVNGYDFARNRADPNPAPGALHGTHVAGLAAATANNSNGVAGVAGEKARIMALNVFGASQGASTPNIDNAIRYAADKGAHVINMSLGGTSPAPSTQSAISYAVNKGTVVIVAAGNSNADTRGFYPASYGKDISGAMAIGATDSVSSAKCGFSNYSTSYVEMAAPGCKSGASGVLATVLNNQYGRLQGTSMASPVTAGVAMLAYGLIWARTGSKPTPAVVEEVMKAGSRVESGLTSYFREGRVVDLVALKDEINTRYPAGGTPPVDPPPVDPPPTDPPECP